MATGNKLLHMMLSIDWKKREGRKKKRKERKILNILFVKNLNKNFDTLFQK